MRELTEAQWRRILVLGTVTGFTAIFMAVFGVCLYNNVPLTDSLAIASVPAVQGSWFYGGTYFLLRAAYGDEEGHASVAADVTTPVPFSQPARKVA